MTTDLRAALKAALPDLTPSQAHAARDLLAALTPKMEEPKWPGAPVIATCSGGTRQGVRVLDILLNLGWRPGGDQ